MLLQISKSFYHILLCFNLNWYNYFTMFLLIENRFIWNKNVLETMRTKLQSPPIILVNAFLCIRAHRFFEVEAVFWKLAVLLANALDRSLVVDDRDGWAQTIAFLFHFARDGWHLLRWRVEFDQHVASFEEKVLLRIIPIVQKTYRIQSNPLQYKDTTRKA